MERTVYASDHGQSSTSSPFMAKFPIYNLTHGISSLKNHQWLFLKNYLQWHWELESQPAVTYGSRIYPPIILSNALVLLHWEEGHFSTVWKYSWLNLVELRCWVMPTFPCLKFPSNGVIPSLSFPFCLWVGELHFTVEGEEVWTWVKARAEQPHIKQCYYCVGFFLWGFLELFLNAWAGQCIRALTYM